jgi:hypothetical protein
MTTPSRKPEGDICNELRFLSSDSIGLDDGQWAKTIMREAADEIARLRSRIIILETAGDVVGAVAAEREACAQVADNYGREGDRISKEYACEMADELAARIRART